MLGHIKTWRLAIESTRGQNPGKTKKKEDDQEATTSQKHAKTLAVQISKMLKRILRLGMLENVTE